MRRGAAIVLTLGILLILFLLTLGTLCVFRFWEKSAFKVLWGRQALRWAKAGVEDALWELDHDGRESDSHEDQWRTAFSGADADNDEDGTPDSRWIEVRGRNGRAAGRYAVLVEDESGRINVNACGTLDGTFNEGWSPAEIGLLPGPLGPAAARAAVLFRHGADGLSGRAGADDDRNAALLGADGIDNDGDGLTDESGEGTDEPAEFRFPRPFGDDRLYFTPEEIRMVPGVGAAGYPRVRNEVSSYSYDENKDRRGRLRVSLNTGSLDEIEAVLDDLGYGAFAAQIAANVVDYRDRDGTPTVRRLPGGTVFGVDTAPFLNEMDVVVPVTEEVGDAGAITFTEEGGQFIEIFNPWDRPLDIGGWMITGVGVLSPGGAAALRSRRGALRTNPFAGIAIPPGTTVAPRSFYTIGDGVLIKLIVTPEALPVLVLLPARLPGGCDQYEPILAINPNAPSRLYLFLRLLPIWGFLGDTVIRLRDAAGNTVDEVAYPLDGEWDTTQKNDPRIRSAAGWFRGPAGPGRLNAVFQPWVGGEIDRERAGRLWPSSFAVRNGSFAVVGELSSIHRGEQWRTLDLWRDGRDRPSVDRFTAAREPALPAVGRLNLNTASETALLCLPLFDRGIAAALAAARPFRDIAEALGVRAEDGARGELSREITRYGGDGRDNDGDGYADTDRERELVFLKTGSLVTVRSPVFRVSAVGQNVRDRDRNGTIEPGEVLAERRLRVWYDRITRKVIYRKEW